MNDEDILAKAKEEMNIIILQLKLEAIQKMKTIQRMKAIKKWRQFRKYCLGWIMNFELPQASACG